MSYPNCLYGAMWMWTIRCDDNYLNKINRYILHLSDMLMAAFAIPNIAGSQWRHNGSAVTVARLSQTGSLPNEIYITHTRQTWWRMHVLVKQIAVNSKNRIVAAIITASARGPKGDGRGASMSVFKKQQITIVLIKFICEMYQRFSLSRA